MVGEHRPELAEWLMGRAQVEAGFAMQALGDLPDSPQAVYLHAGAAVEFSLKAVLAQVNVLLITDARNFNVQWELATSDAPIDEVATTLITIPLTAAIKRAERALPELGRTSDLEDLARHRNAAAHLGAASPKNASDAIVTMLATLKAAVSKISGGDLADFLGPYGATATDMLSRRQTETEKQVAARIVSASERFADRFGGPIGLDLAEALHRSYLSDPDFTSHPCPACDTDAAIGGVVEVRDHVDYDRDGSPSVHLEPLMWPEQFRCFACGLELVGSDEIAAAGIDVDPEHGLPLEGFDADDAIQAYQEDLYMDLHDEDRHNL